MAKDRIVKFCARIGPQKCLSLDDKLSFRWAWSRSRDVFIFWQISVNISKTVQETDILTMED